MSGCVCVECVVHSESHSPRVTHCLKDCPICVTGGSVQYPKVVSDCIPHIIINEKSKVINPVSCLLLLNAVFHFLCLVWHCWTTSLLNMCRTFKNILLPFSVSNNVSLIQVFLSTAAYTLLQKHLLIDDWLIEITLVVRVYESGKRWILLFSVGSWLVLHGVVSVKTRRGMFTSVQSPGPEITVTSSIFKVRFGVLLFHLWPLYQTLAMYLKCLNRAEKTRHLKTSMLSPDSWLFSVLKINKKYLPCQSMYFIHTLSLLLYTLYKFQI